MSDSDDTAVLLLIPNDFFAVDEPGSPEKCRASNSNLMSFSSIKLADSGGPQNMEFKASRTAFDQYCANTMESSLNVPQSDNKFLLEEIDSYLSNVQPLPQRTMYSESTASIPSLRDLWQSEGPPSVHKSIVEERLRRRHLEKNLEATQLELIEAQQKVSVALSVDEAKDVAIGRLRATIRLIQQKAAATEDESNRRVRDLEVELKSSLERSKRLKETNEALEAKVAHLTTATNDVREINRKQLEDLQIRLSNSLKAEQLINDDLVRTRNQLVIEKNCHRENQETWTRKEGNYKGEQESLRGSLKHYYQKQLNDVVNEKLREFQKQMDDLEVQFKMEYLRRERQIAERAIQQMELIYKKNEEEVRLLTEKHQEEVKFVQLQLEMAQTTISEAQHRLAGDLGRVVMMKKEVFYEGDTHAPPKKVNNSTKTPIKRPINNYSDNDNNFHSRGKVNSPELQGYIDTLLKKSPKTALNTPRRFVERP